ncbi:MAG: hypothetical protein IPF62_05315 [Bacteroidetes bacterium]|nr:hypothetical protein [Bacteroidota bacterium]
MKYILLSFTAIVCLILSCTNTESTKTSEKADCEKPTIKDPNEVKPMALMMRNMANYCDTMRLKINRGEVVDSIAFPLMHSGQLNLQTHRYWKPCFLTMLPCLKMHTEN